MEWHELKVLDNFEDQDGELLEPEFEQFPALVLIDVPDQPPQNCGRSKPPDMRS